MDIIDVAMEQIKVFGRPAANISIDLIEDLKRARKALTVIENEILAPEEITVALCGYWNAVKNSNKKCDYEGE